MKTKNLVQRYVETRRILGMRFKSQAVILHSFSRTVGGKDAADVSPVEVLGFLNGKGPLTTYWYHKASALRGLFRFARERGYMAHDPLPLEQPVKPDPMKPFIYSQDDIRRLLAVTDGLGKHKLSDLDPPTFRALLLLLYGAGLRIGEALALTMHDVDLNERLLTIQNSKFFKSRLVAIGPKLAGILADYARGHRPGPARQTDTFFVSRRGKPVSRLVAEKWFRRICSRAGVHREVGARYQPRLHDLRHSFAVHRLISWYQQGADINHKLHRLSVHLGHSELKHTQPYLSMTPELFAQALQRFQNYAFPEVRHG